MIISVFSFSFSNVAILWIHLSYMMSKLNICGFWAVGHLKQAIQKHHLRLWAIIRAIILYFLTFHRENNQLMNQENTVRLIDNENNCFLSHGLLPVLTL